MMIYPLTLTEEQVVRWAARVLPVMAVAVIVLLSAMSVAAASM